METTNDWYTGIAEQIDWLKEKMSEKDYGFYQLDYFLRMVEKVADLSTHCDECKGFQGDIAKVIADQADWPNTTAKQKDDYLMTYGNIFNHLKKHRTETTVSKHGCLIGAICCVLSPILFIVGFVVSIYPQSLWEGTPDWTIFWLFASLSIALFITGIVFSVKGSSS